jgi:hypothetical protein
VLFNKEVRCYFPGSAAPCSPPSPEPYARHHPDRIKKFPPFKRRIWSKSPRRTLTIASGGMNSITMRSPSFGFLSLLACACTTCTTCHQRSYQSLSTWSMLTGPVDSRIALLRSLSQGDSFQGSLIPSTDPCCPCSGTLPPFLSLTDIGLTNPKREITQNTSPKRFSV